MGEGRVEEDKKWMRSPGVWVSVQGDCPGETQQLTPGRDGCMFRDPLVGFQSIMILAKTLASLLKAGKWLDS